MVSRLILNFRCTLPLSWHIICLFFALLLALSHCYTDLTTDRSTIMLSRENIVCFRILRSLLLFASILLRTYLIVRVSFSVSVIVIIARFCAFHDGLLHDRIFCIYTFFFGVRLSFRAVFSQYFFLADVLPSVRVFFYGHIFYY